MRRARRRQQGRGAESTAGVGEAAGVATTESCRRSIAAPLAPPHLTTFFRSKGACPSPARSPVLPAAPQKRSRGQNPGCPTRTARTKVHGTRYRRTGPAGPPTRRSDRKVGQGSAGGFWVAWAAAARARPLALARPTPTARLPGLRACASHADRPNAGWAASSSARRRATHLHLNNEPGIASEHNHQCHQFTHVANIRATLSTWRRYAQPSHVGVRSAFTNVPEATEGLKN